MNQDEKYALCQHLDDPKRYLGLTLDECAPVLIIVGGAFWVGAPIPGFAAAFAVWWGIRKLKKGQGPGWLLNWLYWHVPAQIFKAIYVKTPPSSCRHWLR